MKTNFFSSLKEFNLDQFTLTIRFLDNNQITVALLPQPTTNDKATKQIIPLTFTDTVEQMDDNFLHNIKQPLINTEQLIHNIKHYQAQLEEAERNSNMKKKEKEMLKKKTEELKQIVSNENFVLNDNNIPKIRELTKEILKINTKHKLANEWDTKIKKQSQTDLFN